MRHIVKLGIILQKIKVDQKCQIVTSLPKKLSNAATNVEFSVVCAIWVLGDKLK